MPDDQIDWMNLTVVVITFVMVAGLFLVGVWGLSMGLIWLLS